VDAKAGEECGADRTDLPVPAEEYGPGDGGEERQETRELRRIDRERHAPHGFVSFDVRKVLRLDCGKDENTADDDRGNGYEIHNTYKVSVSACQAKSKEARLLFAG